MAMNVRMIGDNRIGGILVPFSSARDDHYGTRWDASTDFGLRVWRERPAFFYHNVAEFIGRLDDNAFRIEDSGLWAEMILSEDIAHQRSVDSARELVMRGVAAWSSGAWPQSFELIGNYFRRWHIVEGTIVHVSNAGAKRGLTTVDFVRSFFSGATLPEGAGYLERSPMQPKNETVLDETQGEQPNPLLDAINGITNQINALAVDLEELKKRPTAPTRLLPEKQPEATPRPQPPIEVRSQYDEHDAWTLAFMDHVQRLGSHRQGLAHKSDEKLLRALGEKIEKQHAADEKRLLGKRTRTPDGRHELVATRMVDPDAFDAWHKKVPYLRSSAMMGSTLADYGDQLVPTLLNSMVYYNLMLDTQVFSLFDIFEMPSQPYDYPTITSGPVFRLAPEASDVSQFTLASSVFKHSRIGTSKVTFNAGKIGALTVIPNELFEDGGVNVAASVAEQYRREMAKAVDRLLLHGDESATATNISYYGADPTGTAYDWILALDGLRHLAVGASDTVAHTAIASSSIPTIAALMGQRGIIGRDLQNIVALVDPGVAYKYDALTDFQTVEKVGAQMATLLNGQVGMANGVPIVVSDELENTNASGQIEDSFWTGTPGTKGQLITVHRNIVKIGRRRGRNIDSMAIPWADGMAMWASIRFDVQQMEDGGVAFGYNTTI